MKSPSKISRESKTLHNLLGKEGKILTWTKIYSPPAGFENQVPYYCGVVDFGNKKISVELVDFDKDPKIGQLVVAVVRRIGGSEPDEVIEYGIKSAPK